LPELSREFLKRGRFCRNAGERVSSFVSEGVNRRRQFFKRFFKFYQMNFQNQAQNAFLIL